jgi:16S rRNA C967 or C1407 C5-methylase (RsmB/RsmF family)
MGGTGKIDAFELDPKRAAHLQRNVEACGADTIVTVHQVCACLLLVVVKLQDHGR